jgi:hypothetical protein
MIFIWVKPPLQDKLLSVFIRRSEKIQGEVDRFAQ